MEMKCVPRETKEFECFYLKEDNIEEFIKWFEKLSENELDGYCKNFNKITIYFTNNLDFDLDINRWYVWKDSLYDYDEDVFNKIYRRI